MEKRHCFGKGIFALLVATATLAGCSKDSDSNDNPTSTPDEKGNDRNYEENLDQLDPDPSKN